MRLFRCNNSNYDMSKQPATKFRSSTSILSSHHTLLKYWTNIAKDVDDEGQPAQPTACVDVEKQSPVEASSYPNSTYHDGHTDSYSAEQSVESASPEKTQAISDLSNTYRDGPSCIQSSQSVVLVGRYSLMIIADKFTQLKVVAHRLPGQR
jgi:hypothetical protein